MAMVRQAHPLPRLMVCRMMRDELQRMRLVLLSVIMANVVAVSESSVFPSGIPSSFEG